MGENDSMLSNESLTPESSGDEGQNNENLGDLDNGGDSQNESQYEVKEGNNGTKTIVDKDGKEVTGLPEEVVNRLMGKETEEKVNYENDLLSKIPDKYKNANDPVKAIVEAHKSLEQKLHSMKNAPEVYEAPKLPDELKDRGIEIDTNDDLYKWFEGFAKETMMSQDDFNKAVTAFTEKQVGTVPDVQKELEKLGPNHAQMITQVGQKIAKHAGLSDSENQILKGMVATADEFKVLSKIVGKLGGRENISNDNNAENTEDSVTFQSIKEMMEESIVDPKTGNKVQRMKVDRKFREQVMKLANENAHLFPKR